MKEYATLVTKVDLDNTCHVMMMKMTIIMMMAIITMMIMMMMTILAVTQSIFKLGTPDLV